MGINGSSERTTDYKKGVLESEKRGQTKTLIIVILDESGSMSYQKKNVINGYSSFINKQLSITTDQGRLMLIKFNNKVTLAHGPMSLHHVPKLNPDNYKPAEGTALYDAVADGIRMAAETASSNERVVVLIMTDGEENSSRRTSSRQLKRLMAEKEVLGNWSFAYIGENPHGWARKMQQSQCNVLRYDHENQQNNMESASSGVSRFRSKESSQSKSFFKDNE